MSVRVSPISRTAAIIIIALGLFLLVGGTAAGEEDSIVAGIGVTVLGVALYLLLYRFTRRVQRELEEVEEPAAAS